MGYNIKAALHILGQLTHNGDMIRKLLIIIALLPLVAACGLLGGGQLGLNPGQQPGQQAYEQAIAPYLGQAKIYDGPSIALIIDTLPLCRAVRQAQVARQVQAHSLSAERAGELSRRAAAEAEAGLDIMVGVFTPEDNDSKLDLPNSAWRVFIELPDGRQLDPIDVRQVKSRDRNAMLTSLYPFWDEWGKLFRLRFAPLPPLSPGQAPLMVFAGPQGKGRMELKLD